MLRHYVGEYQDDWEKYASAVKYAYNKIVHRSTGATPFELVLGRPPSPFAIQHPTRKKKQGRLAGINKDYLALLDDSIEKARGRLSHALERYKRGDARREQRECDSERRGSGGRCGTGSARGLRATRHDQHCA